MAFIEAVRLLVALKAEGGKKKKRKIRGWRAPWLFGASVFSFRLS